MNDAVRAQDLRAREDVETDHTGGPRRDELAAARQILQQEAKARPGPRSAGGELRTIPFEENLEEVKSGHSKDDDETPF